MQLPRSGQLDERRRRVLTDEMIGGAGEAAEPSEAAPAGRSPRRRRAAVRSRPYPDPALLDKQPRVTDLVPRRYGMIALLFLAGATAIVGLEALYAWMPELAKFSSESHIAALNLDAEGSLGSWFASTTLSLAALVAVLVYTIRRHKADDYHGRYRVWLWAAGCWLAMSVDEGSSLHEGFKDLMIELTGQPLMGDGSMWWIGAYLVVLGAVGTRLALEMRECRSSLSAMLLAGGCYVAAVLTELGWIVPHGGPRGVMIEEGAELAGNLLLLLAMTLHARWVLLAAQGLLPRAKAKGDKPAKAPPGDKARGPSASAPDVPATLAKAELSPPAEAPVKRSWFGRKVEPAHPTPPAPAKKAEPASARTATAVNMSARKAPTSDYDFDYDNGLEEAARQSAQPGGPRERRMSKAERKAMRRQQREQREDD